MNFVLVISTNEAAPLQFILPSCDSKDRSAGKFNVGWVNLDAISKIYVTAITFHSATSYFVGQQSTIYPNCG